MLVNVVISRAHRLRVGTTTLSDVTSNASGEGRGCGVRATCAACDLQLLGRSLGATDRCWES